MRKIIICIVALFTATTCFCQPDINAIADSITAEGQRLYHSEMTSWYGTDAFIAKYPKRENIGGYFSYSSHQVPTCIFFSRGDSVKVIGTVMLDASYNANTAQIDLTERPFTNEEKELYTIRTSAMQTISRDTLFKRYNNTELNLIPLIGDGQKKVYVLTGPQQNGVVIFGNDYLIRYDGNNALIDKKALHRNILFMNSGKHGDTLIEASMHTHLPETGDFITATDICTLMLYEKFAGWKQHIVISANYISLWNCEQNKLIVLTKKAWEKIAKDGKKGSKD